MISNRNAALFCNQLATLLESGVPIDRALTTLGRSAPTRGLRRIADSIGRRVRTGASLTQAFQAHAGHLPRLMIVFVEVGERTGKLEETLRAVATHYDSQWNLSRTTMSHLVPMLFYFAICGALIVFIKYIYRGWDNAWLVRTALNIAFVAACIVLAVLAVKLIPHVRSAFLVVCSGFPVVSGIMRLSSVSRFATAMRASLVAGLDVRHAIRLSADMIANPLLAARVRRAAHGIEQGLTITDALGGTGVFGHDAVAMFEAGELGGRLDETMGYVAATTRFRATTAARTGLRILTMCVYVAMLLYIAYTIISLWGAHFTELFNVIEDVR